MWKEVDDGATVYERGGGKGGCCSYRRSYSWKLLLRWWMGRCRLTRRMEDWSTCCAVHYERQTDSAAWRWKKKKKKKKKTWIRSRGVGWGRKNSYETYIRSSCNAACRVGMGAVQWRYWRAREMTDPMDDGFGWCDQCDCRGSGHMGERVCS